MRESKRGKETLRKVKITRNFMKFAEGSCLINCGNTKIACSASIEEKVPHFLRGKGTGWITAEYGMLPRSCKSRIQREAARGKIGGRTYEIQRLIGRSLRAVVDMRPLGERTIWIDSDVIQADGGTRTAAITGSFIALVDAFLKLKKDGVIEKPPIMDYVAAASVGIVEGRALLDLSYEEDSKAEVDMNVIMTGSGKFIEVQGTAEGNPFSNSDMDKLIALAKKGIKKLIQIQKDCLGKDLEL